MTQAMPTRLIRIIVDSLVLPGQFHIDGVRMMKINNDEALGRELRTTEVRVHDDAEAEWVRRIIRDNVELEETE